MRFFRCGFFILPKFGEGQNEKITYDAVRERERERERVQLN